MLQMLEGVSGKARNRTRSPDYQGLPGMPGFLSRNWNGWAKTHQGLEILVVATAGCHHPSWPAVGMGDISAGCFSPG